MANTPAKPVKPANKPNPLGVMPNQLNNSNGIGIYGRTATPSGFVDPSRGGMAGSTPIPMPKNPLDQQAISMTPDEQTKVGMTRPYTLSEIMNMPWDQWNSLRQKFGVFDG